MTKIDEVDKVKNLLHTALNVALHSMPNNRSMADARTHMRQALKKIEHVSQQQSSRKRMTQDNFQQWWGDVQAGVAAQPMSAQAQQKSLAVLNSMIDAEKSKIDELEKRVAQADEELLSE
jgi:multidrug resistance efflux pump